MKQVLFCLAFFSFTLLVFSQEADAPLSGETELQSVTAPPDQGPTDPGASSGAPEPGGVDAPTPARPSKAPAVQTPAAPARARPRERPAPPPRKPINPKDLSAEEVQQLDTIRYGTETEIAALIQTLKNESAFYLDDELIIAAHNTKNRNILSGAFSFFGDRKEAGLEDRALQAIEERDEEVNESVTAAIAYLGLIGSAAAIPYIQDLIDSREQRFMNIGIRALGLIGGGRPEDPSASSSKAGGSRVNRKRGKNAGEVAEYLIDFYNNRNPGDDNRREIVIALGETGSPSGVPLLREIVENGDERAAFRMLALEALAKIGEKDGLQPVLQAVESTDPNVRAAAVAALGPFSGSDVDTAILEAFRDSYYRTRIAAAQAARERKLAEAIPYLRYRAERDDVPAVKDEAIRALGAIGDKESQEILSALFAEHKNTDRVRILAAEMILLNNPGAYTAKVIEELDDAKKRNQKFLYNGFLRVLGPVKAPDLQDLAQRFFASGEVVEKSYALDMVGNNEFRSLADQVRALTDEKNGNLSRKAKNTLEKLGLGE